MPLGLFFAGFIPAGSAVVLLITAIATAVLVYLRHWFLHPLGQNGNPYYKWLRTTPYTPGHPLPNGRLLPGAEDTLLLAAMGLSVLPLARFNPLLFAVGCSGVVSVAFLLYCYITIRLLLNVGPRWVAYAVLALVVVSLKLDFALMKSSDTMGYMGFTIMPAFAMAVVGQEMIMRRYPWGGTPPPAGALVANRTWGMLQNNYADVLDLGLPYSSTLPGFHWPRMPWRDAIAISLLTALYFSVTGSHNYAGFTLAYFTVGAVVGRQLLYGSSKKRWFSWRVIMGDFRTGRIWTSAPASILVLALIGLLGIWVSPYLAYPLNAVCLPIYAGLLTLSALKLPPSRRLWETTGNWQADTEPEQTVKNRAVMQSRL